MGIDLTLTRGFNWKEDHVFESICHSRLRAIGLRRRHATEGLERQHHVAEFVLGVVDVLAHFKMPLAAARKLVVERHGEIGHLLLIDQVMRDVSQGLDHAMVLSGVDHLADA